MRKQRRVDTGLGEVLRECEEPVQLLWWAGVGMSWHVGAERFASFGVYETLKKKHGRVIWICLGESKRW